jgi:hypothetical protein
MGVMGWRLTAAELKGLRELVMARWDPIGVHAPELGPNEDAPYWDEYDDYLPVIVGHLDRGDGVSWLRGYLARLRTADMGLPPDPDHDAAAAQAIVEWHSRVRQ